MGGVEVYLRDGFGVLREEVRGSSHLWETLDGRSG